MVSNVKGFTSKIFVLIWKNLKDCNKKNFCYKNFYILLFVSEKLVESLCNFILISEKRFVAFCGREKVWSLCILNYCYRFSLLSLAA